ncbi:PREDICTED: protein transport protein Sec24-like At4g32640 isoform X1 [Populus euphratica]|uniref:Protein transport protein Sec24-like At4g32640 isoform X1 n=1 Tax=Populus euphratica TaxID=75702 RepID=A0AAJ6UMI3_POPEU|nr:PREDICTED: protein transport protein Sec24-like At4g32640 isoform X1 [Populus euphratica]
MASNVPPGAPRQSPPPNYNPNYQQNPNILSDNFQNLNLNRPPSMTNSAPRPSPFSQPSPFPSSAPSPQFSRPGAPPIGAVPRPSVPPSGSPSTFSSNVAPGRPTGPPFSQPAPFGSRPPPGSFQSYTSGGMVVGPVSGALPVGARPSHAASSSPPPQNVPPSSSFGGLVSNGPPAPAFQSAPRFPPPVSAPQQQPMGPPPTMGVARSTPQSMRPLMGSSGFSGQPVAPFSAPPQGTPFYAPPQGTPFSAPPQGTPYSVPPQGTPFSAQQGMTPPPIGSPFAPQMQPQSVAQPPPIPGSAQPPRMFGMPPLLPNQMTAISPVMGQTGSPLSGASKIDPNQIPRPIPGSSVILHDTRAGNQANPPPPATSDYIVTDTGNCSPRYMRCTINQIPCTVDLLSTSGMQLALLVQPLALPHPSEEAVQVVDFGESGPVRCSRCKGYINPFMKFIDQGRRFICNLCGFTDETPRDYLCNLGPDGRRRDADERPELCRGTVEFVATKEFMVRDPMPAVYFFLIDVSMHAIQTGATAAACSSISQVIADLPEGPRTMVGIATFDSTIHFYNLKRALQQPLMLIVPDIHDVYTPLQTDVIVPLSECRQHLELLLESIPTMFQNSRIAESSFSAAIKAAFLAMKNAGGKLLVFQSVLPSVGVGALSAREAEGRSNISTGEKEAHKLLQPADKTLKEMAIEFAEYQVCVDVFITTQTYVDIASISVIPKTTGGQVYYYYPFSAVSDPAKLYNDLRWNVTRPQGFEAVMRVRCSQGIQIQEYHGNFCKRIPTDIDLAVIDCDKTIMVTLKHDDKLQDGTECAFQCALLYTTVYGQRRIRVANLSLPCTNNLSNLFRLADLDSQFVCFLKQAANEIPSNPSLVVQEQVTNFCINILLSYRKFCATVSSSGQLILPEALKLLPLYTLALIKSTGLKVNGRIDDRSFWISYVSSVSTPLAIPLVYPRMTAIHNLDSQEADGSRIPPALALSSEYVSEDGIYLLENGQDGLIYIGNSVNSETLQKLFGISSVAEIPTQYSQFVLEQYDNPLSKKLNNVVNEIRRQRCSFLRLKLCKKGDPSGMSFFSYLVEDKVPVGGLSYVEFLVHIHRQIQVKMSS